MKKIDRIKRIYELCEVMFIQIYEQKERLYLLKGDFSAEVFKDKLSSLLKITKRLDRMLDRLILKAQKEVKI